MKNKILIVDDDIWITKVFTKILLNLGYTELKIVHNGFDAVATALDCSPDLILLDLLMPEIDGLTTLKMLKRIPNTSHSKIIICTANGDMDNLTKAMSFGANDFISKPFTTDTIKEKLTKLLITADKIEPETPETEPQKEENKDKVETENKEKVEMADNKSDKK